MICLSYGPFNRTGAQTHECDIAVTIAHSTNIEANKVIIKDFLY